MMKQQPPHVAASDNCDDVGTPHALVRGDDGTRLSAVEDDNDNDEEDEMISLGLSPSIANEDGRSSSSSVVGDCGRKQHTASMPHVGTSDCKSELPATSAASANVYSHQPCHNSRVEKYGAYGPPMRLTPGPVKVAQQAMHRRTPGAGNGNGHTDVSWYFFFHFLQMRRLIT
jgi:hypothetical protein